METNRTLTFSDYLLKHKKNRTTLFIASGLILIQFSIFKYLYPFASYIHGDSFSYLKAAYQNLDINTYMVGYSRFLRMFSVFSTSDLALTAFQYLMIQSAGLFLIFTIFYFYNSNNVLQSILIVFIVLNPLFLHLANLISSDCFFASLSLFWFSTLLWIINKPSNNILFWHLALLLVTFTVRYNALIYPLISTATILLSKISMKRKFVTLCSGLLLCGLFIINTSYKYKQLTGIWQYSPFSGWQLANNAMYAYRYVDSAERKPVFKKYAVLDNMIRQYFDSTRNTKKYPTEAIKASTYYMWSPGMPLMRYKDKLFKKDSTASDLKRWALIAPYYKEYGLYIIKKYPVHFAKHFLWPNANKYYAPPVEFLETYNSGKDSVAKIAKEWFGYKTNKVWIRAQDSEVTTLNFYPILSGVINVIMLFGLIFFTMLNGFNNKNHIRSAIILGGSIWLLNAVFTIGASSAALRFQSFPIIITTIISLLIIDWIKQKATNTKLIDNNQRNEKVILNKTVPTV